MKKTTILGIAIVAIAIFAMIAIIERDLSVAERKLAEHDVMMEIHGLC